MSATRTISSGGTGAGTATLRTAITYIRDGDAVARELPPLYFSQSPVQERTVDFTSVGDNTLSLHSDTRALLIVPKAGNSVTWKVYATGDTGWSQNLLGFFFTTFAAAPVAVTVNVSAAMYDCTVYEF